MLKKILLPLDGSLLAGCVLDHVRVLARTFDSQITALRVLERDKTSEISPDPFDWHLQRAAATAYLEQLTDQLSEQGYHADYAVLEGSVSQRIVEYSHDHNMDLIALSSHGSSGLSCWNNSSVASKVVARAHTSVLIVRAYTEGDWNKVLHYDKVLVPLDGSTRAECILPIASALVDKQAGELVLAHIASRPQLFHRISLTAEDHAQIDRWTRRNLENARYYLDELQSRLTVNSRIRVKASDDTIEALHDLTEEEAASLVVFSAHGISGKRRWPYGSVVSSFIDHSTQPLLIIQDMERHEIEKSHAEKIATAGQLEHRKTTHSHV